jgi:SEC-C motif-containing protein
MRSRFSAFALVVPDYLLATWHRSTRPSQFDLDPELRWYRLDIISRTDGGPLSTQGTVEFEAFWRSPVDHGSQREVSNFVREKGRWFYVAEHDAAHGTA